jgi:7-cyano-7-deazaguanine synthase in queuosine biosynthesis
VTLIHVDYGQKALVSERKAMRWFADKYGFQTYEGSMSFGFSNSHIMAGTPLATEAETNRLELRNLVLISYAASYAASVYTDAQDKAVILVGFHIEPLGAVFPDARTGYLGALERSINSATKVDIAIKTPFQFSTRFEILSEWSDFDPDLITHSHTCYENEVCGVCTHCIQKAEMVAELELKPIN